jgi:hypothetical protein
MERKKIGEACGFISILLLMAVLAGGLIMGDIWSARLVLAAGVLGLLCVTLGFVTKGKNEHVTVEATVTVFVLIPAFYMWVIS